MCSSDLLKVVAVGKNGLRSEAATASFNWGMTVQDTSLPRPLAENIVPGATVIGSTFPNTEGGEGIEGMLNGTITSLSDKWSSAQLSGSGLVRILLYPPAFCLADVGDFGHGTLHYLRGRKA